MPLDKIIIGLPFFKVQNVTDGRKIIIDVKYEAQPQCPHCGSVNLRLKDTKNRLIKSTSIASSPTILQVKAHKFCCRNCGKYFNQQFEGIKKWASTSEPLKQQIFHLHGQGVNNKALARDFGVSPASIENWFNQIYQLKSKERMNAKCPRILGIDEHFFSSKQGFATTLCDLRKNKIFDVVKGKAEKDLWEYLIQLKGKENVQIVVMDLSSSYKALVSKYFPNAMIVADRFHVVKLLLHSFIKTCQSIDPELKWHRGIVPLLRMNEENLSPIQKQKLGSYLQGHPAIKSLYIFMRKVKDLLGKKAQTKKQCQELIPMFLEYLEQLKQTGFEFFKTLGKTFERWSEEIVRMFRFTKSNGITEGFHRKMKLIQRQAYGFRNFENYRLRVIILCGHLN